MSSKYTYEEDPTDMSCRQCHQPHPIHSLVLSDKQLSSLKVVFKAVLNNDRFKDQYQFRVYLNVD